MSNWKRWFNPNPKKLIYEMVDQDSQNIENIADKWGLDLVANEARNNQKDPSKALRKAAIAAATWYAGGALAGPAGSAAGTAGSAAGEVVGEGGPALEAAMAAQAASSAEAAAAAQAAQETGVLGSQAAQATQSTGALGSKAAENAGLLGPQGFGNTMEAGMMDSGYTPSSLSNAARLGPDSGQGMGKTLGNYAMNKWNTMTPKQGMLAYQGLNMMMPQQQQAAPPPPPPPPRQQQEEKPARDPYQDYVQVGVLGMTEEQKRRLRQQGYLT